MPNLFDPGYATEGELKDARFRRLGRNVRVARNCTIVGPENIELGDNVRIDSYASLIAAGSGNVQIGSYVHIGAYCLLAAGDGVMMEDYSGLSPGVRLFSRTDDYSGKYLTNPTIPVEYTGVTRGQIVLRRHVIVGSGSVVLPRVVIGEGAAVGAQSLVTKSLEGWGVYFGSPVRRLRERSKDLLHLVERLNRTPAPRSD
jgi:galactoside O-acetyltransferase